jgi:hypothetical protein
MVDNIIAQIPEIWPHFDPLGKPHIIPAKGIFEEPVVNLCINSTWVGHLSGMIERLIYLDAWEGTDDEKYAAINQVYKLLGAMGREENIGGCNMTCCCTQVLRRINAGGVYQESTDGGTTWHDAQQNDPRQPGIMLPPQIGSDAHDTRCKAANSIVAFLEAAQANLAGQLATDTTIAAITTIITGILLLLGIVTGGFSLVLLTAMSLSVLGLSSAAFAAEFDEGKWQALTCSAYCHIGDDGTMTAEGFAAFRGEVQADMGGVSIGASWLGGLIDAAGAAGMNNAAALPSANSRDCNACACACLAGWTAGAGFSDFTIDDDHIVLQVDHDGGDGRFYGNVARSGNADCCVCNDPSFDSGGAGYQAQIKECGSDDFTFPLFGVGEGNTNCWLVQIRCTEVSVFRFRPQ